MKLTIAPTEHFFMAGDVMVRMWEGTDESGEPCVALLAAVAFTGQGAPFAEGLVSIPPPDAEAAQRWAEAIMDKSG